MYQESPQYQESLRFTQPLDDAFCGVEELVRMTAERFGLVEAIRRSALRNPPA